MLEFDVIIPARYGSTRLPGKPLLEIAGKPLIQWVYQAARSSDAKQVIVATDDARILRTVHGFGGDACMTSTDHASGTDRVAEAVERLGLPPERIVVNLQGDEPQMPAAVINQVAGCLSECPAASAATVCVPILDSGEFHRPSVVKVVVNDSGMALYFSRAPIPWPRDGGATAALRHIGIYAYRAGFVTEFASWPVGELERIEQLEQLRLLERGKGIAVREASKIPGPGIDTAEDLERFREMSSRHET